ncbi:polyprenol phosphomannose-dependent alpha 1,6 mannosyltransferase MptB [Kitasatospora viridis]|uniref:Alpha-1,6-mannosyltransferase/alpha-1, 6-mannosyltransferase n=1 Tax=Kitasatospora viridis TaxID=281105 RepID=A0A561UQ43_9ACTN|nr:polyprenol phosphomannose-dependent alpha 1,6 mannosyltransferase MptB [Kitasatospora viridis]TWG01475.1 alpha-1,6-mannosyltransferase/alpha-1,6-mannosyltransferase [Kitasatospora viridis]
MPNWGASARRCRHLGLVGSLVLALGGLGAGAVPLGRPHAPTRPGIFLAWFGMVLLIAAWLLLGRAVRGAAPPSPRWLLRTLFCWAAPLVLGPPLFSRDVYSYLAQGALVGAGINAYTHGPAVLGGPFDAQVPGLWQHTPAPYGPVFLLLADAVAHLAGHALSAGVLLLRLVALAGLGLLAVVLPRLARACGVPAPAALWLGLLNPLVLFHLVAGAHNDALLLALLVTGLLLRRRPFWAAVLVTLAALVKLPAALGLAAVALLWGERLRGRTGLGRAATAAAALAVAATAVATTAAVTALTGVGYGWVHALAVPVSAGSWSLTSLLGRACGWLLAAFFAPYRAGLGGLAVVAWRWLGLAAAVASVLLLVGRVRRRKIGAVYAVGLALVAVVALGPAIRPWYALWGGVLIAAAAPADGRVRRWAPLVCGLLALIVAPDGFTPGPQAVLLAVGGGVLGALTVLAGMWFRPVRRRQAQAGAA